MSSTNSSTLFPDNAVVIREALLETRKHGSRSGKMKLNRDSTVGGPRSLYSLGSCEERWSGKVDPTHRDSNDSCQQPPLLTWQSCCLRLFCMLIQNPECSRKHPHPCSVAENQPGKCAGVFCWVSVRSAAAPLERDKRNQNVQAQCNAEPTVKPKHHRIVDRETCVLRNGCRTCQHGHRSIRV